MNWNGPLSFEIYPTKTLQILEICVCPQLAQHDPTHFWTMEIPDFRAACLQMDLSRSSGGVGWPYGACGWLTLTNTFDLAGLQHRGKPLDMISRCPALFFVFLKQHLGYREWPNDLLWGLRKLVWHCSKGSHHVGLWWAAWEEMLEVATETISCEYLQF